MPKKLIHSKFEINLSELKTTETEENSWFSDVFRSKISYPFELDLTDELDPAFGLISLYNTSPETLYPLKFTDEDKISDATFEIQELSGRKLQCVYESGLEDFPNFDKKLAELSLDEFDLPDGTTIYEHAETIISQKWPAVNYNFPMVHVNFIDHDEDKWAFFEDIINKRVDGAFVENVAVHPTNMFYNRNIMQPLPYKLYLLKKGIEDAGYTLAGDILNDELLKMETQYAPVEYYGSRVIPEYNIFKRPENFSSIYYEDEDGQQVGIYISEIDIPVWGYYNIIGTINSVKLWAIGDGPVEGSITAAKIVFNGILIFESVGTGAIEDEFIIDTLLATTNGPSNLLQVQSPSKVLTDLIIHDLQILTIQQFYPDGTPIPSVINEPKVNLKKAVPDMTFGEFVTDLKNNYNYSWDVADKVVTMNSVEKEMDLTDVLDFSMFEIENPVRKFQKGMSFHLKFKDVTSKDYNYSQIFHDVNGVTSGSFVKTDKTKTIEINALPLPLLEKFGVRTAFCFEQDEARAYIVLYDGLQHGKNVAVDPTPALLPGVHTNYYWKWFNFRINSHGFKWGFKAFATSLIGFSAKKKIFAYKKIHVVKIVVKTEEIPGQIDVEIETEAFN